MSYPQAKHRGILQWKNLIHVPRQVEMADEQYFVQCGRTVQIGLVGNEETTKWILSF